MSDNEKLSRRFHEEVRTLLRVLPSSYVEQITTAVLANCTLEPFHFYNRYRPAGMTPNDILQETFDSFSSESVWPLRKIALFYYTLLHRILLRCFFDLTYSESPGRCSCAFHEASTILEFSKKMKLLYKFEYEGHPDPEADEIQSLLQNFIVPPKDRSVRNAPPPTNPAPTKETWDLSIYRLRDPTARGEVQKALRNSAFRTNQQITDFFNLLFDQIDKTQEALSIYKKATLEKKQELRDHEENEISRAFDKLDKPVAKEAIGIRETAEKNVWDKRGAWSVVKSVLKAADFEFAKKVLERLVIHAKTEEVKTLVQTLARGETEDSVMHCFVSVEPENVGEVENLMSSARFFARIWENLHSWDQEDVEKVREIVGTLRTESEDIRGIVRELLSSDGLDAAEETLLKFAEDVEFAEKLPEVQSFFNRVMEICQAFSRIPDILEKQTDFSQDYSDVTVENRAPWYKVAYSVVGILGKFIRRSGKDAGRIVLEEFLTDRSQKQTCAIKTLENQTYAWLASEAEKNGKEPPTSRSPRSDPIPLDTLPADLAKRWTDLAAASPTNLYLWGFPDINGEARDTFWWAVHGEYQQDPYSTGRTKLLAPWTDRWALDLLDKMLHADSKHTLCALWRTTGLPTEDDESAPVEPYEMKLVEVLGKDSQPEATNITWDPVNGDWSGDLCLHESLDSPREPHALLDLDDGHSAELGQAISPLVR